ncbi:hypothetical protein VNO78_15519 [Psophocarpus tetragonolobus]|uniref:Uncharacterized protein n=1 Tax=Psophocarpus tetragonolobus TaxID=3891 RepID=A0AAN9XJZ7_PSOTE
MGEATCSQSNHGATDEGGRLGGEGRGRKTATEGKLEGDQPPLKELNTPLDKFEETLGGAVHVAQYVHEPQSRRLHPRSPQAKHRPIRLELALISPTWRSIARVGAQITYLALDRPRICYLPIQSLVFHTSSDPNGPSKQSRNVLITRTLKNHKIPEIQETIPEPLREVNAAETATSEGGMAEVGTTVVTGKELGTSVAPVLA